MIPRIQRQLARSASALLTSESESVIYRRGVAKARPESNRKIGKYVVPARFYSTAPLSPSDKLPEKTITPASPPRTTNAPNDAATESQPGAPAAIPESTFTGSDTQPGPPSAPRSLRSQLEPQSPPPSDKGAKKPRRKFTTVLLAAGCLALGLTAGTWMKYIIAPPALPIPGTPEDKQLSAWIRSQGENLALVKKLGADPAWRSWDAYSTFTAAERPGRITTGPLGGSRGVGGYQRVFKNDTTGEFVSVLWIGGALAGFPGVCHGGLTATILDESLGRCAISKMSAATGVTANLELTYKSPVLTNSFYVIRAVLVEEGSKERKQFVKGSVEGLDGRVHVEAKGLFVVPRGVELRKLGDGF